MRKRKWLAILIVLFFLLINAFRNNFFLLVLIPASLGFFLLRKGNSPTLKKILVIITGLFITFSLLSNHFFIMLFILFILLFLSKNPGISNIITNVLLNKRKSKNEFIIVEFNKKEAVPGKITKNKWLGADHESSESIYSWEDLNYVKLIGNSTFDLGNTLLPREQNIILIRQAVGKVKILIPEGTAVFLDFTSLIGTLKIDSSEYNLLNENLKWHSKNYSTQNRKIKIVANLFIGELEVVFL